MFPPFSTTFSIAFFCLVVAIDIDGGYIVIIPNYERFIMQVPCPRGRNCPGATSIGAPECFVSETTTRAPYFLRHAARRSVRSEGFLTRYITEVGMHLSGATYHVYQCAACGCRVVFMESHSRDGRSFERVYDDLMVTG